jgi:hypothetical protein
MCGGKVLCDYRNRNGNGWAISVRNVNTGYGGRLLLASNLSYTSRLLRVESSNADPSGGGFLYEMMFLQNRAVS